MDTELFREKLKELKGKGCKRPDVEVARRAGLSVSFVQKLRAGRYPSEVHPKCQKAIAGAIRVALKRLFPKG